MSDSNESEACPADLPETGGASPSSPTIHVETKGGTTVRTDEEGARPTH